VLLSVNLSADDGLVRVKSPYSVSETLDRFEAAVRARAMTVFTRVDHSAGAEGVDLKLAPNALLIFGNPKIGSLLMQSEATAGIDLPMKALAFRDSDGQVWLVYNDPQYLVDRHRIKDRTGLVGKMKKALEAFSRQATR
jgi:uncharacterized protein (DUF302 family)